MMEIPELFKFNKGRRTYYFYLGERICEYCGKNISDPIGNLHFFWGVKKSYNFVIHAKCEENLNKIKPAHIIHEKYQVLFSSEIPPLSLPVFVSPPSIKNGRVDSVFEAVNLDSHKTNDRTVYSGRETLEGVSIGYVSDPLSLALDKELMLEDKRMSKK